MISLVLLNQYRSLSFDQSMNRLDWAPVFIRKNKDRSMPLDPVISFDTIISFDKRAVSMGAFV